MFLALILVGVYAAFKDLKYADGLGPREISWPETWVNNLIELDENHIETAAKFYINFNVDGQDLTGKYAAAYLSSTSDKIACTLAVLNDAAKDYTATCTFDFGTDLSYGPIHFVIRESENGEIYAEDMALGYLGAVSGANVVDGALTVAFYSTATDPVYSVEQAVTLDFSFDTSARLYPGDYFKLKLSSKLKQTALTLSWTGAASDIYFNKTVSLVQETVNVGTALAPSYEYYAYLIGLATEVPASTTVKFRLVGFTTASSATAADAYSWNLKVYRFGTKTLIKGYTGTGPSTAVVAGAITINEWLPNNSEISSTLIPTGLAAYFRLKFTLTHAVPIGGKITVTYSGVTVNDYKYSSAANQVFAAAAGSPAAYVTLSSGSAKVTATVTSATAVDISVADAELAASTSVFLYNIVKVTATSAQTITVSSIVSLTAASGGAEIDKYSTGFTAITIVDNTKAVMLANTNLAYLDVDNSGAAEKKNIYLDTARGLYVLFKPPVALANTDKIYFHGPFSGAASPAFQTNKVQFPTTLITTLKAHTSINYASATDVTPLPTAAVESSKLTLTLAGDMATTNYYFLFIGTSASKVYTPYFPTQQSDLSELIIKFTKTNIVYYLVNTFSIEGSATSGVALDLFCLNLMTDGNPATVSYNPAAYTPPTGYGLSLYFTFKKDAGTVDLRTLSKSIDGSAYPTSDTANTYYLAESGTQLVLKLASLATGVKSFKTLLPAVVASSVYKVSVDIYVNNTSTKYLLSSASDSTGSTVTAAGGVVAGTDVTATSVAIKTNNDISITLGASINQGSTASQALTFDHMLIVPQGFSTEDTDIFTSTTGVGIASANETFPYRAYYKNIALTEDAAAAVTLTVKSGWYTTAGATLTYAYSQSAAADLASTLSKATCKKFGITQAVTGGPALTYSAYTPTSVKTQSYDYLTQTVTLKLTNTGIIYKYSTLEIVLDAWTPNGGVTNWVVKVDGTVVSGSLSTKTWTGQVLSEIAASKSIEVTVSGCSAQTAVAASINGFASAKVTLNGLIYLSWSRSGTEAQTAVTAATAVTSKASGANNLWVFPNVKDAKGVYLGLQFTPDLTIPTGSTIAITGFATLSNLKDSVWTSHSYSSVSQSSDVITITLSQSIPKETFKLVVDYAADLTTITPENVKITVKGSESTTLYDDTTIATLNQKYSVVTAPTNFTTSFTYSSDLLYAGFISVFNFTISFNDTTAESFWVRFDASDDFNAIPGPTFENAAYDEEWLYAMDENGDILRCTANHWVISCEIDNQYTAETKLSVFIALYNPQAKGSFSYFLTDADWKLLAAPKYSTEAQVLKFVSTFADSIDLYYADVSYTDDSHFYHDLTLSGFVKADAKKGGIFTVMFPMPYDVELENSDSLTCSLTHNNDKGTVDAVLTDAECAVDGNSVSFVLAADQTFTSGNWTQFTIEGLRTPAPVDGTSRTEWIYEPAGWQGDYYSGKFCVVFGKDNATISGVSYDNLNAAFTAFTVDFDAWSSLVVNGGDDIAVTAGTYSGPFYLSSEDDDINAESIAIKVVESTGLIEVLAENDYADYLGPFEFYIGTSGETPLGIYYLEWSIDETPFDGEDAQYVAPVKTAVYVTLDNTYDIYLTDDEIVVVPNYGSFPIGAGFVSGDEDMEVWPYSDLTLTFSAVTEGVSISFSPESIALNGDWPVDYFTISCSDCVEGSKYEFAIELSGDGAEAFVVEDSYEFTYSAIDGDAATLTLTFSEPESSEFTVTVNSDYKGILTWCIVGENQYENNQTDYDSLIELVNILGSGDDETPTFEELIEAYVASVEEELESEDDYQTTVKSVLELGAELFAYGQVIVEEGDNVLASFTKLSPSTSYKIYAYIDNLTGNMGSVEGEVTTADFPDHAELTITFTEDPSSDKVISELLKFFETQSKNIQDNNSDERRRLGEQSYTVYADPTNSKSPASADKAALGTAVGGTVSITPISSSDYPVPEFDDAAAFDDASDSVLILNFTASADGTLYCLIVNGSGIESTTEEIYYGADGEDRVSLADDQDVYADTADAWVFDFNATDLEYSEYSVSCVLCNNFPGYVSCGDTPIRTDFVYSEEGSDSSAGVILAAICAYFIL